MLYSNPLGTFLLGGIVMLYSNPLGSFLLGGIVMLYFNPLGSFSPAFVPRIGFSHWVAARLRCISRLFGRLFFLVLRHPDDDSF